VKRVDGWSLEDGIRVWEVVVFECCVVDYGRHAEGDVLTEDIEFLRSLTGFFHLGRCKRRGSRKLLVISPCES
jgi:hypothetical protein